MKVGSLVVVHFWRKQRFVGVCASIRRKGLGSTFTLRSHTGTEYTFPLYSPMIMAIELRKKRAKNIPSKAKLYRYGNW